MSLDEASSVATYISPSSDYEEQSDAGPPSPNYVPGPEYPEYLDPSNDEIPVEDQPHAVDASPIALSLSYITDIDLEDELGDGPADYLDDRGDDDDDDSSGDDADYKDEEEASKENEDEEEYLALVDSTIVSLAADPVPSLEETDPFKTDESATTPPSPPAYQVARLIAIPTPPPSPLSPLSSLLPQIPSPPLPVPSLPTIPIYTEAPLGYKVAKIQFDVGEILTAVTARQPSLGVARTTDYGFVDMVDDAPRRHVPREVGYCNTPKNHLQCSGIPNGVLLRNTQQ
ncbi:hypothetical protein Tco_0047178 [Tanacetum coccineum]